MEDGLDGEWVRVRGFVITLVVLVAILVGVDFGARAVASDVVAGQLQTSLKLPSKPSVDIHGFPFITQALAGRYSDVDLTAEHIPYKDLQDITLTANLQGVSIPLQSLVNRRVTSIPTRTVTAQARVTPADLARVLHVSNVTVSPVTQADLDRLRAAAQADPSGAAGNAESLAAVDPSDSVQLTSTTTVLGQEIRIAVIASFRLRDGQIVLSARDIRVDAGDGGGGILSRVAGSALRSRLSGFSVTVDPGELPFAITATDLRAENGELVVSGTAQNVDLLAGTSSSS